MRIAYDGRMKVRHPFKPVVLFKGRGVAKVSPEDYDRVIKYSWALSAGKYAIASFDCGRRRVYLHRFIAGVTDPSVKVDHRNCKPLDCRRFNLRVCTNAQNTRNQRKRKNGSSRFKGVHSFPCNKTNPWAASIKKNYKGIHLGYFPTEESAALAYNEAALKYHGEFARLNEL
jgi:hypothetical protein